MRAWAVLLCWAGLSPGLAAARDADDPQRREFLDPHPSAAFQRLLRDPGSGDVFVGATDALIQLSDELRLRHRAETGPKLDSPFCSLDGRDCITPAKTRASQAAGAKAAPNASRALLHNVNQILVRHPDRPALIACGSLFQGICQLRSLKDVSQALPANIAKVPVAANSPNSSTVGFVGTGPGGDSVLYVGASFTQPYYRDTFPAVATRSLSEKRLLRLVDEGDVTGRSGLEIRAEHRADFPVRYVGGFSSGAFAFWAAVQRSGLGRGSGLVSRLLRVCHEDPRYESYSELTLECLGPDNANYNLLQAFHLTKLPATYAASPAEAEELYFVGVFAKGSDVWRPRKGSAVCLFPLSQLQASFAKNAARCASGVGTHGLPHFGQDQQCRNLSRFRLPAQDCPLSRLGGQIPDTKLATHLFPPHLLTSVAAAAVGPHAVLLFGTSQGRLKKMVLEGLEAGREFGEEELWSGGREAVQSLETADEWLYALGGRRVVRVPLARCSAHSTCEACVQSADPFCGWCSLEARCSPRAACAHAWAPANGARRPDDGGRCPRVAELSPRNVSLAAPVTKTLRLSLASVPPPSEGESYQCVYGEGGPVESRWEAPSTLVCELPPFAERAQVPSGADHVAVPLRLWSSETERVFLQSRLTFFDCEAAKLCTSCVRSDWACSWCLLDNRCVHDDHLCSNQSGTGGAAQCPHIDAGWLGSGDRLRLASGLSSELRVPVANLAALLKRTEAREAGLGGLECSVEIPSGGRPTVVRSPGRLDSEGWVSCEARAYAYASHAPRAAATLYLSAGGSTLIDKAPLELYKCRRLAKDCSRCLALDPGLGCVWCGGGCHYGEQCPFGTRPESEDPSLVCPPPSIHSIDPDSGPLAGGTRLTIRGTDFGSSVEDVQKRILIAGRVPCEVVEYKESREVVCVTAATKDELSGPVSVSIGADAKRGSSRTDFAFRRPQLASFSPQSGPRSGGTELRLTGSHLDVGSHVEVALLGAGGHKLPCEVRLDSITAESITCVTPKALHPGFRTDKVELCIDWANLTLAHPFRYTEDPEVDSVTPLAAFRSGGRLLRVSGQHLNATQEPRIFLVDPMAEETEDGPALASEYGDCRVLNERTMVCQSPSMLTAPQGRVRQRRSVTSDGGWGRVERALAEYQAWPIGFKMDGVRSVRNLGDQGLELRVVPDPELFPFPSGRKIYREEGDPLILEGTRLSLGAEAEDVVVEIGSEACNVTLVAPSQLVCQPPTAQPPATDGEAGQGDGLPLVVVRMGNLRFRLGRLAYASSVELLGLGSEGWGRGLMAGLVAATASVLLLLLLAVAVWWRRKSCQAEKEYKRIQLQMDNLESNVRQECKQAFAELQTDMSDLTSDLVALGIPFHPRRVYAAKILFREDQQAALRLDWAHSSPNQGAHLQVALAQFEALLWRRDFVLGFVEALEAQPSFSTQDRVYVASLLTAALARNMEYLTEVVMELLRRLIARSAQSRAPPQLLLRSGGSVVEKMLSNWIALCLYDYMQGEAGEALFLLLKALKHQVEKGPVDAVTGDARYSLSEDRLLREQIRAEPLTLRVVQSSGTGRSRREMSGAHFGDDGSSSVPCRVLSCDTVSQAKAKILDCLFRNHPFSQRPALGDIDLEWQSPRGPLVLVDDERCGASPPIGGRSSGDAVGWKRLNTLAYYRLHEPDVPHPIVVTLVARDSRSPRGPPAPPTSHFHSHFSATSASSLLIPNGHHSPESWDSGASSGSSGSAPHYWHLVPPPGSFSGSDSGNSTLASRRDSGPPSAQHQATLPKSIPEIYLTRLLTSKGTVQKFVDDFFAAALRVQAGPAGSSSFPLVIKYLFDFLEAEAKAHGLDDPSVAHAWKNNALALRFWVNVVKNPEFVMDAEKSGTVDAALSVVAGAFMDAASASEPRLGKDSPSNRLLFAKDLPRYRGWVAEFYRSVRLLPPVSQATLSAQLAGLSKAYAAEFNVLGAVRELLCFGVKFRQPLLQAFQPQPRIGEALHGVLEALAGRAQPQPQEHIYASVK